MLCFWLKMISLHNIFYLHVKLKSEIIIYNNTQVDLTKIMTWPSSWVYMQFFAKSGSIGYLLQESDGCHPGTLGQFFCWRHEPCLLFYISLNYNLSNFWYQIKANNNWNVHLEAERNRTQVEVIYRSFKVIKCQITFKI